MARHVVLLRGINLGPHHRVTMADLRQALTGAGFRDVVTHLASGNVVLDADREPADLAPAIHRELLERLGLRSDVIVRSADELAAAIAADPFGQVASDPSRHVLGFAAAEPDPQRIADLEARIAALPSDGDRHVFAGRHFYLWCPRGISKSPYFTIDWDRLGVSSTQRNWNTVTALLAKATG